MTVPTAFKTGGAGPRGNAPKGGASTVPPVGVMGSGRSYVTSAFLTSLITILNKIIIVII